MEKKGPDSIILTYDFLKWTIPALKKFPRDQRFLLGDRIEGYLLEILENLITAQYSRDKGEFLRKANLKVEVLRFLWRLSHDLRYLDTRRYEYASRALDEIGRLVGGWIRTLRRKDEALGKPLRQDP